VAGVTSEGADVDAPVVLNCAGLYADRLLRPLGIEVSIKPERHQMCFFRRPGGFGVHPAVADTLLMTYMRPEHGDLTIHGKLSYDEIVDPDSYNEGADPDQIVKNAELIAERFPVMEHGLAMGGYSGLYDATPDHHPVLGAIGEYAGLYADFGWSGHGFKHSPFIGDLMSDLVLHGKAKDFDLTPFRWTRFRDNDLVPSARWTAEPHPKHRA
jgi:sarcosine oxidase subunit beta